MRPNIILDKSKEYALSIIDLYKYLINKREYVLSKQILRSGTSIGANAKEASLAQSKRDFIAKLSISLKEAGETEYWLELLYKSDYINRNQFENYYNANEEIIRIITTILKTAKKNL
ncbi:MAG: four helix bundle protein [Lentimicrobiaceae bacterium]|nr:four helix bundle protein [Lentimicrobiaceae bacterium]